VFNILLQAAVGCYGKAISLHIEQKQHTLAAGLCIELGDALLKMKHTNEACSQYQRAADLQASSPIDQIHALGQVASCKIKLSKLCAVSYCAENVKLDISVSFI
jgi:predicted negative regulator of RcsB-dependent stress response